MATVPVRAVSWIFGTAFRSAVMATASGALLVALAPAAQAAPDCTGDGTANTCVIGLDPLNLNPAVADIASETVDGDGGTDKLQFSAAGLTLGANTIGAALGAPVRFANFEEAQVTAGSDLTLTGLTADTTQSLAWTIDAGGSLFALGGNAIGNGSAMTVNGSFSIGGDNNDETIGSLSGSGTVNLLNGMTLTVGTNGNSSTFSGLIADTGNLTKTGLGTLTLTGNNTYGGTTTVTAGTLEIGSADAIAGSSSVAVAVAGKLSGTVAYNINGDVTNDGTFAGNVTVTGNVANNGVMQPGQSPGIMTIVGNYTAGAISYFDMEVDLDAAIPGPPLNGTTHDYIDIQGNVTGTNKTSVYLTELDATADAGLPTTGDGIQLIRVTGTGAADAFVQMNALNAGAYQYLLRYVPNYSLTTDDGYFLQSAVRDEMVAQPALLSAGQELIRHCFRDDQRIPDSPKGATYGRAWGGYHQGNTSFGADTGVEMDQDYNCTTGGMDWRMGYGWFGGVSGGFGNSNADLVAPAGVGNLDGRARLVEAYASFTSSSLFVNLSGGYATMDWTYTGALLGATTASTSGFIGSAQAGVALDVDPFAVKLMGALNYDGTNCGDSCFGFAVTEDTGLLEAKGTIRFDGVTWGGSIRPWASVSYSDVISDGINKVSLGAVSVASDTSDQLLSIDAGLQTYLDENFALFADGGYHESLSKDITGYKGGVGLKLYW